jgi:hypothetical protein
MPRPSFKCACTLSTVVERMSNSTVTVVYIYIWLHIVPGLCTHLKLKKKVRVLWQREDIYFHTRRRVGGKHKSHIFVFTCDVNNLPSPFRRRSNGNGGGRGFVLALPEDQ